MPLPFHRQFANLRSYLAAYGGPYGIWAYFKLRLGQKGKLVSVKPPGARYPATVRRGTVDVGVWDEVFISGEYAAPSAATSPRYIVDAGANIGLTSIFYAIAFPEATIIAIEPAEENWDLLQRNASAYPKIKPTLAALWPTTTRVNIANPTDASVSFFCSETNGDGTVETVTVPGLMQQHEMPHIDILKVDVEGAEKAIFSAAAPWIGKVRRFAIEFHDRKVPGCRASFEAVVPPSTSECTRKGQTDHITMKSESPPLNSHP